MDDFRNLHGQEKTGCCDLLCVSAARGRAQQLSTAWHTGLSPGPKAYYVCCLDSLLSRNVRVLFAEAEGCRTISAFQEEKRLPCSSKMNNSYTSVSRSKLKEGSPPSPSPAQPWQQRADNSLPLTDWQEAFTTAAAGRTFQVPNILPAGSYAHFSCKMPLFASHHHLPPPPNPSFPVLCSPTTVSFTRNHQTQG